MTVTADDLIPLFRDAASVNMTEEAVERQAKRFADAVLLMFDVSSKEKQPAHRVVQIPVIDLVNSLNGRAPTGDDISRLIANLAKAVEDDRKK